MKKPEPADRSSLLLPEDELRKIGGLFDALSIEKGERTDRESAPPAEAAPAPDGAEPVVEQENDSAAEAVTNSQPARIDPGGEVASSAEQGAKVPADPAPDGAEPVVEHENESAAEAVTNSQPARIDQGGEVASSAEPDANSSDEAGPADALPQRKLNISYCHCSLADVEADAAYAPYYLGTRLMGPAVEINRRLEAYSRPDEPDDDDDDDEFTFSLQRLIDLGIVVGNLGSIGLIPILEELRNLTYDPVRPRHVILGGLGEPGSLARDDIRFIMTNLVYAIRAMRVPGQTFRLATSLIGVYSRTLNAKQSLRATIEGLVEGMARFDLDDLELTIAVEDETLLGLAPARWSNPNAAANQARDDEPDDPNPEMTGFFADRVNVLQDIVRKDCVLRFVGPRRVPTTYQPQSRGASRTGSEPEVDFTRLTITVDRPEERLMADRASMPDEKGKETLRWIDFKYSALTSNSAVPVREVSMQKHFADNIPRAVLNECDHQGQWEYGNLMMHCFIPDDFQKMIDDREWLTIVVDRFTAGIPWEMAGFSTRSESSQKFYGTDKALSRQFRSALGATKAHAPEVDHRLNVLIIGDPVSEPDYALPGAAREGFEIATLFLKAKSIYGDRVDFHVDMRVGNANRQPRNVKNDAELKQAIAGFDQEVARLSERFPDITCWTEGPCRPIEILKLLVHNRYDIVHFAGHGRFVPETGDIGWMLDGDCTLTAREIFRVRNVPRLVFANACRSGSTEGGKVGETPAPNTPEEILKKLYGQEGSDLDKLALMRYQVSMAEAFFARGIPNYLGTGWNVDDAKARAMALEFYARLLGWNSLEQSRSDSSDIDDKTQKSIGEALKEARCLIRPKAPTFRNHRTTAARHEEHHGECDHPPHVSHSEHITWGAYQHYGLPTDQIFKPRDESPGAKRKP